MSIGGFVRRSFFTNPVMPASLIWNVRKESVPHALFWASGDGCGRTTSLGVSCAGFPDGLNIDTQLQAQRPSGSLEGCFGA